MSAPRDEPAVTMATALKLSSPFLTDPVAMLLLGAAMLATAAVLRRAENGHKTRG